MENNFKSEHICRNKNTNKGNSVCLRVSSNSTYVNTCLLDEINYLYNEHNIVILEHYCGYGSGKGSISVGILEAETMESLGYERVIDVVDTDEFKTVIAFVSKSPLPHKV